jgi:Photosynthesis system II assembly factor YCF48/Putative zinc-finger
MAQIPKIGLLRLQQRTVLQSHPDAELITAFIENSITTRERAALVEHLSKCYDCREIVSLSMPERLELAAKPGGASQWLYWPALRWVGAVACVAVVGTAVTLHYEARSRSAGGNTAQPIQLATLDQKSTAPASPAPAVEKPTERTAETANPERRVVAPIRRKKAIEVQNDNLISSNQTADMAQTEPEPNSQLQSADALDAQNAPAVAPSASGAVVPGRAKEAAPAIAMDKTIASQEAKAVAGTNAMVASRASLLPRWALNSDGSLQRSRDGGNTWELVSVAPQSRLRAIAANGLDIWVGGSSGALYHSSDAGEHWSQVRPVVNGVTLSADIIGVEFPDLQHGKISTSSLETWTTDDAGQHWQKQ